ncbi:Regulatory protein Spx [compost metagenome]
MLVANSGLELKKFFNTSGEVYKNLGLKDKLPGLSEEEQLDLLSKHGMLIKRPVVTDGKKVTVGFKEEQFSESWSI